MNLGSSKEFFRLEGSSKEFFRLKGSSKEFLYFVLSLLNGPTSVFYKFSLYLLYYGVMCTEDAQNMNAKSHCIGPGSGVGHKSPRLTQW